ncbi:hypothetical protein OIU76_029996 [Salix suchowensis]|nr:hypothetical protein OIU76_029996 [Salix suchowensis]
MLLCKPSCSPATSPKSRPRAQPSAHLAPCSRSAEAYPWPLAVLSTQPPSTIRSHGQEESQEKDSDDGESSSYAESSTYVESSSLGDTSDSESMSAPSSPLVQPELAAAQALVQRPSPLASAPNPAKQSTEQPAEPSTEQPASHDPVEIDLQKKLRESVNICLPNGEMIERKIMYETLLKFCSYCKVLGHMVETCSKYAKSCGKDKGNSVGGNVETPFSPAQRGNVSAANAYGKGLQQGAANVQDIGLQQRGS